MNKIKIPANVLKSVSAPKYKLIEGGEKVLILTGKDANGEDCFKMLKIHNINPNGFLCDDLETFVKWEEL